MPFYDVAAQNAALDALWGDGHAPSMPAAFDLGLICSDPRVTGVVEEMPADGSRAATRWAIFVGSVLWDHGPLDGNLVFAGYARITGCPNSDTFWDAAADGFKTSKVQTFSAGPAITPTVRFNGGLI